MHCFITGTGRCLPERVVANIELDAALGTEGEWIVKSTGIKTRHWVDGPQATSELAASAARLAVERAGVTLEAIDYLIAGTMTPDHQVPGIGPLVQAQLGLRHIPSLDIRTACCNPLYAFDVGSALLHAGRAEHVLIVGAEVQSKGLKLAPQAKEISALFGDGAGACVLARAARPGSLQLLDIALFTDGTFAKDLAVLAPGTANGARWQAEDAASRELEYPVMNGRMVILHAARKLGEAAQAVLARRGWTAQDIDLVIPHQANGNLLVALARQLGVPAAKMVSVVEWSGNTSSASILIALDWAYEQGLLQSGRQVLFAAFAAGFAWGAALGKVAEDI
jgi:3-oxoacyl-[acyl-carrier-protein] synthase-3